MLGRLVPVGRRKIFLEDRSDLGQVVLYHVFQRPGQRFPGPGPEVQQTSRGIDRPDFVTVGAAHRFPLEHIKLADGPTGRDLTDKSDEQQDKQRKPIALTVQPHEQRCLPTGGNPGALKRFNPLRHFRSPTDCGLAG